MPKKRQPKKLKVSLAKMEDDRYAIIPLQYKGLVFSGGGAKGIAYGGMIKAIEESGQLKQLTHVSGASSGAMTASLIAIGMSSEDIGKLVSQLDFTKLLDRDTITARAKGDRLRNVFDVIYLVQIKQHLAGLVKPIPPELEENYNRLMSKAGVYEFALSMQELSIENVDDIIKLSQSPEKLIQLDEAFKGIPHLLRDPKGKLLESPHFTLGDLGLLRELLPEKDKHLIKNITVCVTNQSKNTLERYNEETTPQQPIAQVVQWSGALPILFFPGVNEKGEYVADGGLLDNMPEIDGLNREEVLYARAESAVDFQMRVKNEDESTPIKVSGFRSGLDLLAKSASGGTWLNSTASLLNREKVFHHIDNMLFISTGEITTTNTSPTDLQKKRAVQNGYAQTMALIENQTKTFDHPLMAILYVGFDQLDNALWDEDRTPDLFHAAAHAKKITLLQKAIVDEINQGHYSKIPRLLAQIEDVLDVEARMNPEQKAKALALCHKQVNHLSDGKLVNYLNKEIAKDQRWAISTLKLIALLFSEETPADPVKEVQSEVQEDIPVEGKHWRNASASQSTTFFKSEPDKRNEHDEAPKEDEELRKGPEHSSP